MNPLILKTLLEFAGKIIDHKKIKSKTNASTAVGVSGGIASFMFLIQSDVLWQQILGGILIAVSAGVTLYKEKEGD